MKVLVTGSGGFIGAAVERELTAWNHTMVSYDSHDGMDVCDRGQLQDAVRGVDAVIHLAGILGTAEMFGADFQAVQSNVIGAVNVYNAAALRDIPVVQIATGHKGQPNPYAITKACAEDLGLARARYMNERIVVVRAFHVYGPGQKPCPPHGPSPVRKMVPSMVCRALTGMPIEIHGTGRQLIDLVHVDDVASVLVAAIRVKPGMVVEAGTGKPTTVHHAACDIAVACGSASPIVSIDPRPGEPVDAVVVANEPACRNPWPYRLGDTVDWYRRLLK